MTRRRKQVRPEFWVTDEMMRRGFGLTRAQWRSLRDAADDASMNLREYMRQMLLICAGHGGIIEHAERAVDASFDADKTGVKTKLCETAGCADRPEPENTYCSYCFEHRPGVRDAGVVTMELKKRGFKVEVHRP